MGTKRSKTKLKCKEWNLECGKHEQIVPASTIMKHSKLNTKSNCICAMCSRLRHSLDLFQGSVFDL